MKEQYIKQVSRELSCSRSRKKDILRDLEEAFASSLEHGETEEQIIERLGTPEEFAAGMSDMNFARKMSLTKRIVAILCTVVVVAVIGALGAVYLPKLFVRGNPIPYFKAAKLIDDKNHFAIVEDKKADGMVLITSDPDGLDVIEYIAKTYGTAFDMRVGDTFVFTHGVKRSIKIPVGTELFFDKYTVWDIPTDITELAPNHELLDNGGYLKMTIDEFHELVGEPVEVIEYSVDLPDGDAIEMHIEVYYNCNGNKLEVHVNDGYIVVM